MTELNLAAISPQRLHDEGQCWRTHQLIVPPTVKPDDLTTKPEIFQLLTHRLRRLDHIEVVPDDLTWYAELLVLDTNVGVGAITKVIRGGLLEGVGAASKSARNTTGAYVKECGPQRKWCVFKADHKPLKEGMASEDIARQWLAQHVAVTEAPV